MLYGDNRGLVLAPHNVYYNELSVHIKAAKLQVTNTGINNFSNPVNMNKDEKQMYDIMQPKDYFNIVVPFSSDSSTFLLSPKEYIAVIKERQNLFASMKMMIKEANLQEEQEKALHVAIQGYFREWLVSTGNIKNMTEIVKMIDVSSHDTNI